MNINELKKYNHLIKSNNRNKLYAKDFPEGTLFFGLNNHNQYIHVYNALKNDLLQLHFDLYDQNEIIIKTFYGESISVFNLKHIYHGSMHHCSYLFLEKLYNYFGIIIDIKERKSIKYPEPLEYSELKEIIKKDDFCYYDDLIKKNLYSLIKNVCSINYLMSKSSNYKDKKVPEDFLNFQKKSIKMVDASKEFYSSFCKLPLKNPKTKEFIFEINDSFISEIISKLHANIFPFKCELDLFEKANKNKEYLLILNKINEDKERNIFLINEVYNLLKN